MAVTVSYDQDCKMIISGVECSCGCQHHAIDKDIYIGKGLLPRIPSYIAKRGLGTHCVLVADDNTYRVAGAEVEKALTDAGFSVVACVIHRERDMLPDDLSCGEVLLSITRETEFLIAVGSGSVTDTTRINAERTGLPFVSVGTAPSMDGYASAVAPLLHRGLKIQRPAVCPEIIVCDLDVLATAPMRLIASGVGDVLGKYIAKADWQLGQVINGEPCCPVCVEMVTNAVNALVDNVEEIAHKTEKGMRILIEALLLSGVTIMIIDNTRAVASIEHNIAQYWEMILVQQGKEPPMHGASVGVSTLLVWPMFERFAREDLSALDLDAIRANRISPEKAGALDAPCLWGRGRRADHAGEPRGLPHLGGAGAPHPRRPAACGGDPSNYCRHAAPGEDQGRHDHPARGNDPGGGAYPAGSAVPLHALWQGLPYPLHPVQTH